MTIFYSLKNSLDCNGTEVSLPQLCTLSCPDGDISPLQQIRYPLRKKGVTVISAVTVAADILRTFPQAQLQTLSTVDAVVCKPYHKPFLPATVFKCILAFLFLFFASGTAMINFYTDADMSTTLVALLKMFGGSEDALPPAAVTLLYDVGLLGGMLLFLGIPKSRNDPDPDAVAVEMETYDTEVETYLRSKNK